MFLQNEKERKEPSLPVPSEDQIKWHEAQIGVLFCLGLNTYYNLEWGDGKRDISVFNPKKLD